MKYMTTIDGQLIPIQERDSRREEADVIISPSSLNSGLITIPTGAVRYTSTVDKNNWLVPINSKLISQNSIENIKASPYMRYYDHNNEINWEIVEIDANSGIGTYREIAQLILDARNCGFREGGRL
jgi:hypothetical protein